MLMLTLLSQDEFASFYDRHYKAVYRLCFTYMKNASDAEDCTEDVFVKVFTGDYKFNDEDHEKKWLTVTAMNVCKDKLKHWWNRKTAALDEAQEVYIADEYVKSEVLDAVMKLPVKYKDVIYMYYYMGYKTDEIAKLLKKPHSTVRNHLSEARSILKEQLGGVGYE